ncbi:10118_t:CDS:2, partial [Funneliformis caledonium]
FSLDFSSELTVRIGLNFFSKRTNGIGLDFFSKRISGKFFMGVLLILSFGMESAWTFLETDLWNQLRLFLKRTR